MAAFKSVSYSSVFAKPVVGRMVVSQVDAVKYNLTMELY